MISVFVVLQLKLKSWFHFDTVVHGFIVSVEEMSLFGGGVELSCPYKRGRVRRQSHSAWSLKQLEKQPGNCLETAWKLPGNMELYLDLHSQPCRSVFMFAKLLKIPFEFKLVDLSSGQQYGEDFGKTSMVRKVPVMKDGNFILTESVAILQYMAQKHPGPDHWYPADLQQRARVHEYLSWQHTNLRAHGSKVFLLKYFYPLMMDAEVPPEKMDAAMEDLKKSLDLLENFFLQKRPFIAGDKISMADLVAIVEIMQPVGSGIDVFEGRPKLSAWRDAVKKEVGEKLFAEAHDVLLDVSSSIAKVDKAYLAKLKPQFQKTFS